MREIGTHQGRVIIECDKPLSAEQLSRVSEQMQQAFPSGCVILTDGLRISRCEQMDRIEAKLDWLLAALSGDEEGGVGEGGKVMGDNVKSRMPERPDPPPSRVQYNGLMFGSPAELAAWKAEPWWRRWLGLTPYDMKMRRRPGGRWGG